MDITPEDLEHAAVESADKGFDPDRLRLLLKSAAERIRYLEQNGAAVDLVDKAAELAARRITEADQMTSERLARAELQVEEMLDRAESDARRRAATVLGEAQRRLDRMLAAERNVHDRLQAAVADLADSVARVGVDQSAELPLTIEPVNDPVSIDDAPWADATDPTTGHH